MLNDIKNGADAVRCALSGVISEVSTELYGGNQVAQKHPRVIADGRDAHMGAIVCHMAVAGGHIGKLIAADGDDGGTKIGRCLLEMHNRCTCGVNHAIGMELGGSQIDVDNSIAAKHI